MIISLVVIMSLNGQDFERRMPMDTMELCWQNAQSTMTQLRDQHADMDTIGVGCVVDKAGLPL